jgi:hypothetical protein
MLRCLILCYQVVEELIAEGHQKLIPNGYGQGQYEIQMLLMACI